MIHHRFLVGLLAVLDALEAPAIEIAASNLHIVSAHSRSDFATDREVCSNAQPNQVWNHQRRCYRVDLAPNIRQVAIQSDQNRAINGGLDRTQQSEKQRHPRYIEPQLDRVKRCAVLREKVELRYH